MTTLATLKADIEDWTGHSFTDPRMNSIIRMMQADMARMVRVQAMVVTDDQFLIYDERELIPEGFLEPISLTIDGSMRVLQFLSPQTFWNQRKPDRGGTIDAYTRDGKYFVFDPAPSAETIAIITYMRQFPDLLEDGDTNWLLTNHYAIPLYSCLGHAFSFVQDDVQASKYGTLAESMVRQLNIKDQFTAFAMGAIARPETGKP